jgi:hypothetical protein
VTTSRRKKRRKPMLKPAPGKRWVRLSPAARLELILREAIVFFCRAWIRGTDEGFGRSNWRFAGTYLSVF